MDPLYHHLSPEQPLPELEARPFRAILIADMEASRDWRNRVADWLVDRGCLYFIAWGVDCEVWHDTVDEANLEAFDYGDIPDDRFVMTTWHAKDPLSEALWFAGNCANHPDVQLEATIIFHVAPEAQGKHVLQTYRESQELAG